jgi:DNA polymerase (family 10)
MESVPFKPRAYEKAATSIEGLQEEVEDIYAKSGLEGLCQLPGVGSSIAVKIEELIKTGKLEYYEELKQKAPVDFESLSGIEGLGPKKIKLLWEQLQIRNIDDLEKAAREHTIAGLPRFKQKTEENLLNAIEFAKKRQGRFILGFTLPLVRSIEEKLRQLPEVKKVVASGSVRRMKETVGDVDFLVITENSSKIMDFFVSMPEVHQIVEKGKTKSTVKLITGMNADVRTLPEQSFGAALQYFTGSKDHNIALRKIALNKGWKLSEYGIFEKNHQIAGRTEEEVYEKLVHCWIPPELRENKGEIEAAIKGELPKLVDADQIRGDLQVHTNWTDGQNSIKQMAETAHRNGLEYIVISDHSKTLAMTGGLDEEALAKQAKEIDKVNQELTGITVLKGVELNILKDGSLDISDDALSKLDVVGAAVHSYFDMSKEEMTHRVTKAIENPNLDILLHPTGRQIKRREPAQLDIEKIIHLAKETGTILDIDSFPDRLDLKDEHIRKAVQIGAKLGVSTDSHSITQMHYLELGVAQARRGWAKATDIVNTRPLQQFKKMLKHKPNAS